MAPLTRTTDRKARVSLPSSFANATVLIEQISETEIRIRKAQVIAEDELPFREETATVLSDADRDRFLALLDEPPRAGRRLKQDVTKYRRRNG